MDKNQTKNGDVNKLVPFEDADLCLEDPAFILDLFPVDGGHGHLMMFLEAVRSGLYPPVEVIDWLFIAFQKFIDSAGERELEDILGLNLGPGRSAFFKNERNKIIKKKIADDVDALFYLGLSVSKACKAVAEKCSAGGYQEFRQNKPLSERTIRSYHSSEYELKTGVATKEKPFTFCVNIILEKSITSINVASASPDGDDIKEKLKKDDHGLFMNFHGTIEVESLKDRGIKALKSFPEATQLWVESEIK